MSSHMQSGMAPLQASYSGRQRRRTVETEEERHEKEGQELWSQKPKKSFMA